MISALVLTKNEEENIVDCLETLTWCDEIVVIDDYSQDRTVEIVQNLKLKTQSYNLKLKIYKRGLNGDFASQRNFGLSKTTSEWVFFIDADERITNKLKNEIINLITSDGSAKLVNGYFIKRKDFMWGRELKHGEAGNINLLRLARREVGKWEGKVHEEWKIKGEIDQLKNPLLHYPHQTIPEFLEEINFYTGLRARELYNLNIPVHRTSIILYPAGKFIYNYFLKLGFLDGIAGLIFAIVMSFHSFLVRGKLWFLWNR